MAHSPASVLLVPSPFESLSLVLLEAWNHAVPALVNGRCSVLKGQARRANGALSEAKRGHERCVQLTKMSESRTG